LNTALPPEPGASPHCRGLMSPVKRRRRLPTLVNRGLGLLEVILPRGTSETGGTSLPPGKRDESGFWFPAGYDKPGDIFSPLQRELQETQRRIQRRRLRSGPSAVVPAGNEGAAARERASVEAPAAAADRPTPRPKVSSGSRQDTSPGEIPVPLPAPLPESFVSSPQPPRQAPPAPPSRPRSDAETPLLPDADVPIRRSPSVDSREGSD
jgi:hypothetical protein